MGLRCEKTGAVVFLEWSGKYLVTDMFVTDDETIIFQRNVEFDSSPRGVVHYKISTWEKEWGLGDSSWVMACTPDQYIYYGYDGKTQ